MTSHALWLEYLESMNMIAKAGGYQNNAIYALDEMRKKAHARLQEYYEKELEKFDPSRLYVICSNLDKVIDFWPPVKVCDSVNVYAKEIDWLCSIQAGKCFLTRKTGTLTTKHGVIVGY